MELGARRSGRCSWSFRWWNKMTSVYKAFRIRGTCKDALGALIVVDDKFDLREFWELTKAAQRVRPHEWEREVAKSLEQMEKHLKAIAQVMKKPEMQRAQHQMIEQEA